MNFKSEIDPTLNQIFSSNEDLVNIRKLSLENKSTWLIESKTSKYVLKKVAPIENKSLLRSIFRFLNSKSSNSFNTELFILKNLNNINYHVFNYPKLIKYKENDYLLMEYIPSTKGWDKKNITSSQMANALFEFNLSGHFLKKIKNGVVMKFINRAPIRIFQWSVLKLWKVIGIKDSISCIKVLIKSSFQQKKSSQAFIMHKDLIGNNNVLTSEKKLYFCDFENVIIEKKWILNDAIDVALSKDLDVDKNFIDEYLKAIERNNISNVKLNIEAQFRVALLYRVIRRIFSNNEYSKKNRDKWVAFLRNQLLLEKNYKKWYLENVGIY